MIQIAKTSDLLKLPEQLYSTIKRVGILNKKPILYGDVNLLKPNDLYYINGAKLIYRYVKSSIEDSSITYYFDTIKSIATDNLSVPEEERGHIRNAGYLFNKIIYSGDPNLVDNGMMFYHDTLPYIGKVNIINNIVNIVTLLINEELEIVTINNKYYVSPNTYDKQYLTLEALLDGVFTFSVPPYSAISSVSYSVDEGATWVKTNSSSGSVVITTPTVLKGSKVLWKGEGQSLGLRMNTTFYCSFLSTCSFNAYGNIMSILYEDDFKNKTLFKPDVYDFEGYYVFYKLFSASRIVDAGNLVLPVMSLSYKCYNYMFLNCTELLVAPQLPATTLAVSCYEMMFQGCAALTTPPSILPSTDLALGCYLYMFKDCTSLTTAPELPATTLAETCYYSMFKGCTSLTTAPDLLAKSLVSSCYGAMFEGCTKLNYVKAMFTTNPGTTSYSSYCNSWLANVSSEGTFVKNKYATWTLRGSNGIPTDWTIEIADS